MRSPSTSHSLLFLLHPTLRRSHIDNVLPQTFYILSDATRKMLLAAVHDSVALTQPNLLMNQDCLPATLTHILDRLYLTSYAHAPSPESHFPYPEAPTRSPNKRSSRAVDGPSSVPTKDARQPPCYFTVDDQLFYNAFHHDFGPFHIGHLYRFALQFHDVLGAKENQHRPIVFWSRSDPRCMFRNCPHVLIAHC